MRRIIGLTFTVVLVILIACHLYFKVDGSEISELINANTIATVQITKTRESSQASEAIAQMVLSDEQTQMLVGLLDATEFKRIISRSTRFYSKVRYLITATNADDILFFRLESYGGEFVLIDWIPGDSPARYWKLRIQNEEWEDMLEQILALSDAKR